jgi:hypothetical protein
MRIDAALEALSKVKDLTLDELTILLEAIQEKVNSSQDFDRAEKDEFFFNVLDDVIGDCISYKMQRETALAVQAENDVFDRRFGFVRGDTTHD